MREGLPSEGALLSLAMMFADAKAGVPSRLL
jgi:hypothetical protein